MVIHGNRPPGTPKVPTKTPTSTNTSSRASAQTAQTTKTTPTSAQLSTSAFSKDAPEGTESHGSSDQGESLGAAAKKATDGGGNLRRGTAGRRRTPSPVLDGGGRKMSTADAIAKEEATEQLLGLSVDADDAPAVKKPATGKPSAKGAAVATTAGAAAPTGAATAAGAAAKAGEKGSAKEAAAAAGASAASGEVATQKGGPGGAKAVAAGAGTRDRQDAKTPQQAKGAAGGEADGDEAVMAKAREAQVKTGGPKGAMASQLAAQLQKAAAGTGAKKSGEANKSASGEGAKEAKGGKGAKSAGPTIKGGGGAPIGETKQMRELEGQLVSDRESGGGGGQDVTADMGPAAAEAAALVKADLATQQAKSTPAPVELGKESQLAGAELGKATEVRGGARTDGPQDKAFTAASAGIPKADIADVARDLPDLDRLDGGLRLVSSGQRESDVQDHLQANTDGAMRGGRQTPQADPFDEAPAKVKDTADAIDGVLMSGAERAKAANKGVLFLNRGDRRGIDFPVINADLTMMAQVMLAKGIDISDITSGLEAQFDADGDGEGEEEMEEEEDD